MIELSSTAAFTLYLGATLSVVLGVWIYGHFRYRRNKIRTVHQKLTTCEYCHFAFLCNPDLPITRCPQCQSYLTVN